MARKAKKDKNGSYLVNIMSNLNFPTRRTVCIPVKLADELNLNQGDEVRIRKMGDFIVIGKTESESRY